MIYELIAWFVALTIVANLFYRRGVKAGVKHSLLTLRLNEEQVNLLNEELCKDGHDLAKETLNEIPKRVIN